MGAVWLARIGQESLASAAPLSQPKKTLNDIIEVERRFYLAVFLEHCLNASDHLTCTVAGTDDIIHGVTRFIEIGRLFREPSQASIRIRYHGRQRLLDLVGD